MRRVSKSAVSYALAILILIAGTAISPNSVLCLGPGNHCHLETIVGASCSDHVPVSDRATPSPRDGCPKGSKDVRLGVDTHRTNKSPVATSPPILAIATGVVTLPSLPRDAIELSRFPRSEQSQTLTVVLRF